MHKAELDLRTGTDKNGKAWYGVVIKIGDFETDLAFIDKIHYMYLNTINTNLNNRVSENSSKH